MKNEQRESYTEVLTILNYMETEYQEKIPKKLIEFFKRNSAKDYKFDIDLGSVMTNKTVLLDLDTFEPIYFYNIK